MTDITDFKRQNKIALRMILSLDELKEQYALSLQGISMIGAQNLDGMPHGTSVGNPTLQKCMKLLDVEKTKNWIIAIETMETKLNEVKQAFLRFRREAEKKALPTGGRPGWFNYVEAHFGEWFYDTYGRAFCLPKRTMMDWQREMVDMTVRLAIYHGAMK